MTEDLQPGSIGGTPPTEEMVRAKEAAEKLCKTDPAVRGALGYGGYDAASERRLQIFHTILQARPDVSVDDAAKGARDVYDLLCGQAK